MSDEHLYPLYAQNTAKQMHLQRLHEKIRFVLITPVFAPAECVWVDTGLGLFSIVGKGDKGFMSIRDLPKGTLIINQRYESEDTVKDMM